MTVHATRRRYALLAVAAIAVSDLISGAIRPAPAQAAPRTSPPGRVMVVTNNLQEGFHGYDLRDMREVRIFSSRVLKLVPYTPDLMLMQEVRLKSARYLARQMSRKTGHRFVVAVRPGRKAHRIVGRYGVMVDMAIVMNATTMAKRDGGYITTTHTRSGLSPERVRHARGMFREKNGGLLVSASSSHLPKRIKLPAAVSRLATAMQNRYPLVQSNHVQVLGGDFNRKGIRRTSSGMTSLYWHRVLTHRFRYTDPNWEWFRTTAVDFTFAKKGAMLAGYDKHYDPRTHDPRTFYSDHRFRWALVAPDHSPPTRPRMKKVDSYRRCCGDTINRFVWEPSGDAGSGVGYHTIWRSTDGASFRKVAVYNHKYGQRQLTVYIDHAVDNDKRYWYRVFAHDRQHNRSQPASFSMVAGN